ncbi:MAG: DMT family transporter [Candidatus Saccharimonas sp.]
MTWQLFTLISVVSLSFSVILQRVLLHKDKTDPIAYVIVFQGIVGALLMIPAVISGFSLAGIAAVALPALISIVLFGIGHIVYAKTLQRVEASAFSVLLATQAVWTMLLGFVLLHESLTLVQILGTVLIFASVGVLARNVAKVFRERGTLLGLLTGLMFGVAVYTWSYVGRHVDPLSWAAISFVGTTLVVLVLRPRSVRKMKPFLHTKVLWKMLALGATYGLGSLMMLLAYKYGTFAIVSPLRQTSIILTVLLALLLLPAERNHIRRKIIAAVVCTIGVILIVV